MLKQKFLGFLDWFIPPDMSADAALLGRARIFVFSHLFGPFLGHAITVYLYFADDEHGLPFWVIVACIDMFWVLPFLMKYTGRLQLAALLSVILLTFVTLYGSYYYGGVSSPFLPWLLTALLLGFFYLHDRPLLVLSVFGVNITGFFAAYAIRGSFPEQVPLHVLSGVGIISVISATVYVAMMACYYSDLVASQSALQREAHRHSATAARLRKATEQAERANQQKSVFLAKMSHQFRTPLNAVIGYSEILLEDAELADAEDHLADLRRINSAGKHLLSLVTDVLDMSKIEADQTELAVEPFELKGLIDDVAATTRNLVEANGNEFAVELGQDLGIVISDAMRLRQIILNLLSNAGKFTKHGRVTLRVSRKKHESDEWIEIAVADTGIGISKDNLDNLFRNFNQADASTSSKFGGTGLGLALSRSFARMMGGDIQAESEIGRGSCFTARLPAELEETQSSAPAESEFTHAHAA